MKIKRVLSIILITAFACLSLSACENDTPHPEDQIINFLLENDPLTLDPRTALFLRALPKAGIYPITGLNTLFILQKAHNGATAIPLRQRILFSELNVPSLVTLVQKMYQTFFR